MKEKLLAKDIDIVMDFFLYPEDYYPRSRVAYDYNQIHEKVADKISNSLDDILSMMHARELLIIMIGEKYKMTDKLVELKAKGGAYKEYNEELWTKIWQITAAIASVIAAIIGIIQLLCSK